MNPTSLNGYSGEPRAVDEFISEVLAELRAMRSMKANWDGYNADVPSPAVLEFGERFLDFFLRTAARTTGGRTGFPLYISPARNGGLFVQIELLPIELEFDIGLGLVD